MSDSNQNTYVATVNVRDDFFNDPFFKDWWSDFEGPMSVLGTSGIVVFEEILVKLFLKTPLHNFMLTQMIISDGQRRTLVDSFLSLKENNDDRSHTYQQSGLLTFCVCAEPGIDIYTELPDIAR